MTAINIENLVATTQLHYQFNLDQVATQVSTAEYDPNEKAVVVFHFDDPKSAVLLSSNGKLVCTGTTTLEQAEEHLHTVIKQLQTSIDSSITMQPISQENILASADLQRPLDLDTIAQLLLEEHIVYQPEINPWLRYHLSEGLVVLLFPFGRLVFLGRGEISLIEDAFDQLTNKLSSIGFL